MKHKKALATLVMALSLVMAFMLGAQAADGLQEVKAYLNANISLKVDGVEQTITDASGVRTYPITYNDTTYLPVRSIASLLGIEVGWDQATQSVLLGKQPSGIDLIDTIKAYHFDTPYRGGVEQVQSGQNKTEDISGKTRTHWLSFRQGINYGTASASFSLEGKYQTLTFSYYSGGNITPLQVLGDDGAVLFEKEVTGGQVAQTVTIPLFGTNELKFVGSARAGTVLYIFDAKLDAE